MRVALASLVCILALSGCFLDQKEPTSGLKPGPTPYLGIVALEDVSGYSESAAFYAGFTKREETKAISRRALAAAKFDPSRDGEPQCEFAEGAKSSEPAVPTTSISNPYLNVGVIGFGPALQSTLQTVEADANNRYVAKLSPNLPGSAYQVIATGKSPIEKFADFVSLPEDIGFPTANRVRFEDGLPLIQGNGITLEWDRPAIQNDENSLYVDLLAETDTQWYQLHCKALEVAFGTSSSRLKWDLPQADIAKIPVTGAAALYFMRAHVRGVASSQVEVKFEGLRTQLAQVVIFNP